MKTRGISISDGIKQVMTALVKDISVNKPIASNYEIIIVPVHKVDIIQLFCKLFINHFSIIGVSSEIVDTALTLKNFLFNRCIDSRKSRISLLLDSIDHDRTIK